MLRHAMPFCSLVALLFLTGCEAGGPGDSHRSVMTAASARLASEAAGPDAAKADGDAGFRKDVQAGTLTAASFDDVSEPLHFERFARRLAESRLSQLVARFFDPPLVIQVRDAEGRPLAGAVVTIAPQEASDIAAAGVSVTPQGATARTRTDGRAVFMPGFDRLPRGKPLTVRVAAQGAAQTVAARVSTDQPAWTIDVPGAAAAPARQLDLAFVIDCTGSMTDELEYLKVELRSIVELVGAKFPRVKLRYALIAYRDEGDEYVTRSFDFTGSLSDFRGKLGAQSADGGGDTPEAVHKALDAASRLEWSLDAGTARVLFHVADAEPHDDKLDASLAAAAALRTKGVAVYPIASSGVAELAEFVFRSEAMLTGAQYCFLTDDSGVGNAHAEPHFPRYDVQKLNKLMIRLIESELAGRAIQPVEADILRKVINSNPPVNAPVSREGDADGKGPR